MTGYLPMRGLDDGTRVRPEEYDGGLVDPDFRIERVRDGTYHPGHADSIDVADAVCALGWFDSMDDAVPALVDRWAKLKRSSPERRASVGAGEDWIYRFRENSASEKATIVAVQHRK